jgi:nucleoside-diphosphate-sugar epimerase
MTKVLVTGGGGFVGNVLVRRLLSYGYQVRVIDNFIKGCYGLMELVDNPDFEFIAGDITDYGMCKLAAHDVDGIIHLAAIVGFPDCAAQPGLAEAVNVNGTANMLMAADGRPFVFASTGSVYGKVEGVCTEDSPRNAQSWYGKTKFIAEQKVIEKDNTVAFRFATGFGLSPNMRVNLLVNDFVYKACYEKAIVVFQADFRRTFIHVNDMAKTFQMGLEGLMQKTLKHRVYNAGGNHLNWTKRELAEYVGQLTGCLIHYAEIGTDADQRDYEVDYSRWYGEGFTPDYTIEYGINQVIRATPLIHIVHQYQ